MANQTKNEKIIKGGATLLDWMKNKKIDGNSGILARNWYALSSEDVKKAYNHYRQLLTDSSNEWLDGFYEAIQRKGHALAIRKDHRLIGSWDRLFFRIKPVSGEILFFLKKYDEVLKDFKTLPPSSSYSSLKG